LGNGLAPNISNILNLEKVKHDLKENIQENQAKLSFRKKNYVLPDKTILELG